MLPFFRDYAFEFRGKNFQAQAWGDPGDRPVMALHGWLDNSNSFTPLAEHLEKVFLVAVDLAGHGLSDHRSVDAHYNIWQNIPEVFAIADQLGWSKFSLLGHSMGGISAILAAGTFPRRIERLVVLDALIPMDVATQDSASRQLAKAVLSVRRLDNSRKTIYPSREKPIEARTQTPMGLSRKSAELLAERGIEEVEDGYRWRTDPRLMSASEVRYTEEQYLAFLNDINCPTLIVLAEDSTMKEPLYAHFNRLLVENGLFQCRILPGGHHFHMEDETVNSIAETINQFLSG